MASVTLRVGQVVAWDEAPDGVAQVLELRRSNVVLGYRRDGRLVRKTRPAGDVAAAARREPLLVAVENLLGLGVVPRQKTFEEGKCYGFAGRRKTV